MTKATHLYATVLSLAVAVPVQAEDAIDLLGTWHGTYRVVSPTNEFGTGPRFDESEWQFIVKAQQDNLFWGESNWRTVGAETWVKNEATGSISVDGSGVIAIVQTSPNPAIGVNALIDARLQDNELHVVFRSTTTGATYSAILERQ